MATFHSARSQGATLKLANLGSKFKEVLQVTKLMTVFDTYDSETAAIQSFARRSSASQRRFSKGCALPAAHDIATLRALHDMQSLADDPRVVTRATSRGSLLI